MRSLQNVYYLYTSPSPHFLPIFAYCAIFCSPWCYCRLFVAILFSVNIFHICICTLESSWCGLCVSVCLFVKEKESHGCGFCCPFLCPSISVPFGTSCFLVLVLHCPLNLPSVFCLQRAIRISSQRSVICGLGLHIREHFLAFFTNHPPYGIESIPGDDNLCCEIHPLWNK